MVCAEGRRRSAAPQEQLDDSPLRRCKSRGRGRGRDSCMRFAANAVRLQLHALAYNLANFLRTLGTPAAIETLSLTSLRERLIKTGARLVRHARYAIFQFAEAALPRTVFAGILGLINGLRGPPAAAVSV